MTAQASEILNYEGQAIALCEEPLAGYFNLIKMEPPFVFTSTALWRGYVGSWEITQNRLYLVGLKGWIDGGRQVDLSFIFPDYPRLVFAHWVTGRLRATRGELLEYVHQGYASTYEQDVFFDFDGGILKSVEVRNNGSPSAGDRSEFRVNSTLRASSRAGDS
jgi:hypothetical protein